MKDRKKLSEDVETVFARLADLEMAAKIAKCRDLVNYRSGFQDEITALRRELFTAALEQTDSGGDRELDLTRLPIPGR